MNNTKDAARAPAKISVGRSAVGGITAVTIGGAVIDLENGASARIASTSLDGGATSIDVLVLAIPVAAIEFETGE